MKMDGISNQLRWVILLLAAAVILPTVCLLWFMNQAVKNERLAVRQKLVDFYTAQAQHFFIEVPNLYFTGPVEHMHSYPIAETRNFFGLFAAGPDTFFQGMLIYNTDGNLLYPVVDEPVAAIAPPLPVNRPDPNEPFPAPSAAIDPARTADIMRYRVFLAEQYLQTHDDRLFEHLRRILGNDPFSDNGPAETTVWQLDRLIAMAHRSGLANRLASEIQSAQYRIAAYKNAYETAYRLPSADSLNDWPDQTIRRLAPDLELFGFKLTIENQTVLGIAAPDRILKILTAAVQDMEDDTVSIRITDNLDTVVAGSADNTAKPFLTLKAGTYLPDFTVSVFFKDASVFEHAARRQTSVYTWTGILVALLILLAGSFAIRSVNHQIKMNRLKNDFIATVTHELKTPLSSMRVLVDTLLEGRYENEKTANEYLQMVANENKRLTHLIDSFLTFSRMERNKQVFDFQPVPPAEIASETAEAMQAKFQSSSGFQPESQTVPHQKDHCNFSITIAENLPSISADKDAMVTVLVNLLDNAYKYTNDDKQIELNVFQQDGFVCFAVKDNGIGLSPRAQKKIFNRFYQIDSRLSRRAQGCGLGLSIVRFIVDAHKGKIDVQSQPKKGSLFIVKLPAL